MKPAESVQAFYERNPHANPQKLSLNNVNGAGHFNVFTRNDCFRATPYNRRDFYKISLIIGTGRLYYADKWIDIDKNALLFSNPAIPYSWEAVSEKQEGFFCMFTESFIHTTERAENLQHSPLFKIGGNPVFFINKEQQQYIEDVFRRMIVEIDADYIYKYDLLRNYVHLIIHEAMKMQPAVSFEKHPNASTRIAAVFVDLLEKQFPVDISERSLQLKTANDFASHLAVHVNHLNRAVKEVTGKTTTAHIAERVTAEAKSLLLHTDWNIAEIAYSLGFEYPAYFNTFFKKQTQHTPASLRKTIV